MTVVKFDGAELDGLERELGGVAGRVNPAIVDAIDKAGKQVAARAQMLAPKRTGKMARSITSTLIVSGGGADVSAEIGPSVFYGRYQEHGTSKMAAHPFLGPALEAEADAAAAAIAEAAREAL